MKVSQYIKRICNIQKKQVVEEAAADLSFSLEAFCTILKTYDET